VDKIVHRRFYDRIVYVSSQRERAIIEVPPVVIAFPIAIEIEVGDVIRTRAVTQLERLTTLRAFTFLPKATLGSGIENLCW
jgi:hypothetical protein